MSGCVVCHHFKMRAWVDRWNYYKGGLLVCRVVNIFVVVVKMIVLQPCQSRKFCIFHLCTEYRYSVGWWIRGPVTHGSLCVAEVETITKRWQAYDWCDCLNMVSDFSVVVITRKLDLLWVCLYVYVCDRILKISSENRCLTIALLFISTTTVCNQPEFSFRNRKWNRGWQIGISCGQTAPSLAGILVCLLSLSLWATFETSLGKYRAYPLFYGVSATDRYSLS